MKSPLARMALFILSVAIVMAAVASVHFPKPSASTAPLALHLLDAKSAASGGGAPELARDSESAPPATPARVSEPQPSEDAASLPSAVEETAEADGEIAAVKTDGNLPSQNDTATGNASAAEEDESDASADAGEPASSSAVAPDAAPPPEPSVLASYRQQIYALIETNKRYPAIARRLGHTGTVGVTFTLARSGELTASAIKSGSGFTELDQAALAAVRSVERFPAFPQAIQRDRLDFRVSLVFELE